MGISFLDGTGDTKIRWGKASDAEMKNAIGELIERGYSFFVDDAAPTDEKVVDAAQLTERSVVVTNKTLAALYARGDIQVVTSGWRAAASLFHRLVNAEEIVEMAATPSLPAERERNVIAVCQPNGG